VLSLAGKKYAKNNEEMAESLFQQGGTCAGYYRVKSGPVASGVLLLDLQKNPFAFAVRRGLDSWFVTAGRDAATGRTRYMYGTDEAVERKLGIDSLLPSEKKKAAESLIAGALLSMGK
jgi:hypothetical protein